MVAVPGIRDCFPRVFGDMTCKVEGSLHSECLRLQNLFGGERCTVRWGEPSCFRVITMRWHHVAGSPYGTRSITPRASSRRRSSYTCFCQCSGTLAGVWHAFGSAVGSTCISTGGPSIHGSARWGHVLNVEEAYLSRSQASIRSFSCVGGNGNADGRGGAAAVWGQEHDASPGVPGASQPQLISRVALMQGGLRGVLGSSPSSRPLESSNDGKSFARIPRLSIESGKVHVPDGAADVDH